jgi:hypothetical protein
MDRRLSAEDVTWLKQMRAADDSSKTPQQPPGEIGQKLFVLGFAAPDKDGFRITYKGRDELIDREREEAWMR